jgi:plasmid stabilization system protein ParE
MTVWRVRLTEPVEAELDAAYLSRSRFTSPEEAARWYEGLQAEIFGLAEWPRRCARVEAADYGYSAETEVRRLRYGRGQGAWHIVYQVIEPDPQENDQSDEGVVRVLHVVSAIRRPPGQSDRADEEEDQT